MTSPRPSRFVSIVLIGFAVLAIARPTRSEEFRGPIKSIDFENSRLTMYDETHRRDVVVNLNRTTGLQQADGPSIPLHELNVGASITVVDAVTASTILIESVHGAASASGSGSILHEFWNNFRHNLFKPLLLFFYMGFLVPILRVQFEFPYAMYQALTIYLLIAIGWHGGEELAQLEAGSIGSIFGFIALGFLANCIMGGLAYTILRAVTNMRRVDQATVAGFYGSDSAGTFVTALGVLGTAHIAYDAYMPVMLAVMEIPGCLVALFLVSRLRSQGMDASGMMPYEEGYDPNALPINPVGDPHDTGSSSHAVAQETKLALEQMEFEDPVDEVMGRQSRLINGKLLHEVFLNTGLYLLFGGIVIGFISGLQGPEVTRADDSFFVTLFQGVLCLFLLEMGMTASRKLRDLKTAGWGYVIFGILAPNLFAGLGITFAHAYAWATGTQFELGTYVLFSVLCGSASYIAVPAVQRLAIPEASPTLPLAASLGLTFSYNVTIGIPVYLEMAKAVTRAFPIA